MSQAILHIIDSHTEGEPTRVVIDGGPDLGGGSLADQARRFQQDHDWLRSAVCNEPRGHEAMVGALLCEARMFACRRETPPGANLASSEHSRYHLRGPHHRVARE